MEPTKVLGLHLIIVTAFLFFFLFKTVLLITKKTELLDSIRSKTKIIDIVLGVLIIASGVYLMVLTKNHSMWINMKALMVLVAIPIGIIAMKKSNVVLAIVVNLLLIAAYGIGEAKPWIYKNSISEEVISDSTNAKMDSVIMDMPDTTVSQEILEQNQVNISTNAGEIYVKFCVNCHGDNGMLGKFGAANLAFSTMGTKQKIDIISNGKGVMAPYKDDLSTEEIEALAVYLTTLKR